MADNTVAYIKYYDAPPVPVTARINWLADGTIRPLMYWTPDNECRAITHIFESTPLAYLKESGAGLRFKIMTELREIYLYLADKWFCGRNIIDGRYVNAGKMFISVTLDIFPGGTYEIVGFVVCGTKYMVEKTLAVEPRGSFSTGGTGTRHKVKAYSEENGAREAALYFEINKWFVAVEQNREPRTKSQDDVQV